MEKYAKIYVAGHRGLVGSAIVRLLQKKGFDNLLLRTSQELDLRDQNAVRQFFEEERPEYVFLAAAKVGGIVANNTYAAEFIYDNIMIESNVIEFSKRTKVKKLLFLGSSCIYPKYAPQPIKEEYLLTGELEPTNEPYALAKITGLKMCEAYNRQYGTNFLSVMPTNLYGINDNFDLETSHVLPALMRKFHDAKIAGKHEVEIWGTGTPRREFLFADDLADSVIYLMERYNANDINGFVNIGVGKDISIRELATLVKKIVGYDGDIVFNPNKPDGTPQKLLDISKMDSLGWKAQTSLKQGIKLTYDWFVSQYCAK